MAWLRAARRVTRWPARARRWSWWPLGGALGALARYGIGLAVPHQPGTFPLATFAINVVGCLLIGALIVVVTEPTPRRCPARS